MQQVLAYVLRNIDHTMVDKVPFDHLYVENVFPDHIYQEIINRLPPLECYTPISETGRVSPEAYPERYVIDLVPENISRLPVEHQPFWTQIMPLFTTGALTMMLRNKFDSVIRERYKSKNIMLNPRAVLVRDLENYSIGPHSDSVSRFMSGLFYLPADNSLIEHGTSLYEPKEPGFTCEGGPHYSFEEFNLVKTAAFAPNTMAAFPTTNKSFHGVEPVNTPGIERNLILLNVGWSKG